MLSFSAIQFVELLPFEYWFQFWATIKALGLGLKHHNLLLFLIGSIWPDIFWVISHLYLSLQTSDVYV